MHQQSLILLHPTVKKKMHLQLNTLFDIDLWAKCCPVPSRTCDLCTYSVWSYCVKRLRKRNIYKKIQYTICCPVTLHHMTYSATEFEVASSNRLGGDTFTRKYIIWSLTVTLVSRPHEMLPSTLYIMWPIQLLCFEVATFNGLGGDTFTRNVTDRWGTDFGTKFIYPFF